MKQVHSLADLTADWRQRATSVLGEDATRWVRTNTASTGKTAALRADDVPLDTIANLGRSVVEVVGEKRSTWRRWNLHAEASRQLMGIRFTSAQDREAITGMVTDAALGRIRPKHSSGSLSPVESWTYWSAPRGRARPQR